jgi:transposase
MGTRDVAVTPSAAEVSMVEPEVIRQVRALHEQGWGTKRIAREVGIARNTVKRYLRGGEAAQVQLRPGAWSLSAEERALAVELLDGEAEGNAVVVSDLLAARGIEASVRTVQRVVEVHRSAQMAAQAATVRFETEPGHQMQIDFGEKWVRIAGEMTKVHLLAAVLGYSRRIFVKAFLSERQDDWREGIAGAFRHFGGVPHEVLGDNARALVTDRDRATGAVRFNPSYLQFCRDWGVTPRACGPYRARTKGKVESGVKYAKRNGLAARRFASFAELEAHLAAWCSRVDRRLHKSTHERPLDRFAAAEQAALRPLPARPLPTRQRRLTRRVTADSYVEVDTVRYSVPFRFVRDHVEILVGEATVLIFHGATKVAEHRRSCEPHSRIFDPAHLDGLWKRATSSPPRPSTSALEAMGRSLADYAAVAEVRR